MTHKIIPLIFLVVMLGLIGCAPERYTQNYRGRSMQKDTVKKMTQQDVIDMSKAGVSDSLIIVMMDATDSWFQLKPQDVINLRNAGVSERAISAMLQQPPEPNLSGNSDSLRYYVYPPYYWYDGFNPNWWYYPRFSVRFGFPSFHHHGRFH